MQEQPNQRPPLSDQAAKSPDVIARTMRALSVVFNITMMQSHLTNDPALTAAMDAQMIMMFTLMWCRGVRPKDLAASGKDVEATLGGVVSNIDAQVAESNRRYGDICELLDRCAND